MVDYVEMMGVDRIAAMSGNGGGVRIAVLDSGTPPSLIKNIKHQSSLPYVADAFGHATAVASILLGGEGIRGLCPESDVTFIPVLGEDGSGSVKSVSDGIYKAIDYNVDLINLSLGFFRTGKCPKALEKACEAACESGKTVICAAGNDGGRVCWPAALKTTISVGSSDQNGLKTSFSSVGEVDFVAPGVNLPVFGLSGDVKRVSGTSFSAALVAGVAALLVVQAKRAVNSGNRPRMRPSGIEEVMGALCSIAKDVDEPGWDKMTGYGLIAAESRDPAVCMMPERGFFGRIFDKIKNVFGLNAKGEGNVRI